MRPQSVDDYGDDYGLRKDAAQSSTEREGNKERK
jgi:hypothetical protein